MKKLLIFFSNFVFIISLLFSGFLLLSKATSLPLPKIFLVSSGSMEPAIKTGSLVFTIPQKTYAVGDIITFKSDAKSKITTTHRVVAIGGNLIKTAGDANNSPDSKLVNLEKIIGKVYYALPYLGYLAGFIQTPQGFILFVIVPATILIYEELKSLFFETKKHFLKKITPPSTRLGEGLGVRYQRLWIAIIPLLFTGMVLTVKSNSYFSDQETSTQNSFTAWTPEIPPDPTAKTLVINELLYNSSCGNAADKFFIEFWNGSSQVVDLKDWKLIDKDENTIQIVNSITPVQPNQFALITKAQNTWNDNCYGNVLPDAVKANLGGNINLGTSGTLKLIDPQNNIVDRIDYGNNPLNPESDQSIERINLGYDTAPGDAFQQNDFVIRNYTTPGFGFFNNTPIVINESLPTPSSGPDWIEIYNRSGATIDISDWKLDDTTSTTATIPASTSLLPNEYLYFDVSNRLNTDGDKIYLRNSSGQVVDGFSYFKRIPPANNSIGRSPNGQNSFTTFSTLTKGAANP